MKYCQNCGTAMENEAVYCTKCGTGGSIPGARSISPDEPSTGLNVLSFFFPLVGLILYLVWKDAMPLKSKAIGKWAVIGFIAGIVGYFVVYGCTLATITSSMY